MAKEMMNFNLPKEESSIIKVIGVGGGGSNAVNHMYEQGIRGVDFVVCNTDQQALDMSPVPKKIALGASLTEGRGAGAQAEVGRNAAIENLDDIKAVLENNTKMVFITAGMGGGTGTGAAPVIAQAAREMGILTVGIVTIPFNFEGRKRKIQADKGLEALKQSVDTVLVISNDKLREMYGNLKLSQAFCQADDVLSIAAKGIAEIITVEGYVNVDFEDVRTVMSNSGVAIMGSATTSGQDRAIKAVQQTLASPLLNDNNIYGASNILLYISSGREEVTMDEVSEITDYIQEEAGLDADVIWGNGYDENLDDKLSITVIATGFTGEKLEKVTGNDNVIRHTLSTDENAKVATPEKKDIPTGLTTRPVLLSRDLNTAPINDEPQAMFTETSNEMAEEAPAAESIIRHTLEEDKPEIMAYKVDENDEALNAIIDAEAPEMLGVQAGQELPQFEYEEEEEEMVAETSVEAEVEAVQETVETIEMTELPTYNSLEEEVKEEIVAEQPKGLNFQMHQLPVDNEVEEVKENDTVITTETPTEIRFNLNEETTEDSDVVKHNLFDELPTEAAPKAETSLREEPTLITRDEPINVGHNSPELQKIQFDRMERLRHMNARFRSPNNLAELENVPAFKRRNVNLNDIPHSSESSVTNLQVTDGDETDENGNTKGGLSSGNAFLHESVD